METTATVTCPNGTVFENVECSVEVYMQGQLRSWEVYLHGMHGDTRAKLIATDNETLSFEFADGRKGTGILTSSTTGRVQGSGPLE